MQLRRGRPPHPELVTPAEAKVLDLVREGTPNAEIAIRLGISINTVRYHVSNLLGKAAVQDRDALKLWDGQAKSPPGDAPGGAVTRPVWLAGAACLGVGAIAVAGWFAFATHAPSPGAAFPRYDISVLAGDGSFASRDGPGANASFRDPRGIAVAGDGNVYVTEVWNACIREIAPNGTVATLTTTAEPDVSANGSCEITSRDGSPSIVATGSSLYTLHGIGGMYQYVRGFSALPIPVMRESALPRSTGDGPSSWTFAAAPDGSFVLPDATGNRIVRWAHGAATVIAGDSPGGYRDGPATSARFLQPIGVAVRPDGGIYVSDTRNHVIRLISPSGAVTTVAGTTAIGSQDGPAATATFVDPGAIALDAAGNLWISDNAAGAVRVLTNGRVFTVATGLQLGNYPGIAAAPDGSVYVVESGANRILKLSPIP